MSAWAKFTLKALRGLAEAHNVEIPSRAPKAKVIEIFEETGIMFPWEGPDWECLTPAALIRSGLLLEIAPKSIWRAVQSKWPDYRGANGFGSIGVYRRAMIKKGLLSKTAPFKPTKAGKEALTGLQTEEAKTKEAKEKPTPKKPTPKKAKLPTSKSATEERLLDVLTK